MHPKSSGSSPAIASDTTLTALNERIERKLAAVRKAEFALKVLSGPFIEAQTTVADLKFELEELRAKREQL